MPEEESNQPIDSEANDNLSESDQADPAIAPKSPKKGKPKSAEPSEKPVIAEQVIVPSSTPKGTYPTAFYIANGIPVCPFCGEKKGVSCPENKDDCPVLTSGNLAQPILSDAVQAIGAVSQVELGDFGRI